MNIDQQAPLKARKEILIEVPVTCPPSLYQTQC